VFGLVRRRQPYYALCKSSASPNQPNPAAGSCGRESCPLVVRSVLCKCCVRYFFCHRLRRRERDVRQLSGMQHAVKLKQPFAGQGLPTNNKPGQAHPPSLGELSPRVWLAGEGRRLRDPAQAKQRPMDQTWKAPRVTFGIWFEPIGDAVDVRMATSTWSCLMSDSLGPCTGGLLATQSHRHVHCLLTEPRQ
jgi:hypothetical protein